MTRPLLIVAACATLVSLFCFVAASAIGPLSWPGGDFGPRGRGPTVDGDGELITRTLMWSGADELEVNVPARVIYTQGPEAGLEISGPAGTVNAIEVDGETIRFKQRVRDPEPITIRMTAADVESFTLNGAQELSLEKFDQDRLEISVRGSGDVKGSGRAREVEVTIAGAGDVDLAAMQAESAEVHIAGAGDAVVSPSQKIEVHIAGAGDVTLTTRPPEVETHVAGAGGIKYGSPAPPAAPSATKPPPPSKDAI